jgi:polysaccharide biosynthesis protein PelG
MAGIGFRLRALSAQDNLFAPVASIGHAAVIAAGPWLFTVTALELISILTAEHASLSVIDGFRLAVIYAFAISLICSAPIILVAARLVGDALYTREVSQVRALFLAASVLSGLTSLAIALLCHLVIHGVPAATAIPAASCCAIGGLIWVALAFCGAVRDYKRITQGFLCGLCVALVVTVLAERWNGGSIAMIWAFNVGLLIALATLAGRVLATFPQPVVDLSAAIRGFGSGLARHLPLALAGLFGSIALWIDKLVMWTGPAGIRHELGLVHAPLYDSAIFAAQLTLIPALALFVTHVETSFYSCYRSYYAAIRNHCTLGQIEAHAESLKRTTLANLGRITFVQAALCLVVVLGAPTIIEATGQFFQQVGVLRLGAIGALFHFVFFAATSLLLFFDRHVHFLTLQAVFLVLQGTFAMMTVKLGIAYYGLGYLAASVISAALALAVLERTMQNLTFLTFCRPPRRRPLLPRRSGLAASLITTWSRAMHPRKMRPYRAVSLTLWSALAAMTVATALHAEESAVVHHASIGARSVDVAPTTPRPSAAALAVGDRLRIAFHEIIDLPGGSPASRSATSPDFTLRTFYQRTDLGGEYVIDQDGIVSLPRLGRFQVTSAAPRDLEALLAVAFTRATEHPVEVNVSILDRRPIYVVGAVKNAGAFKLVGHMSVLQAVALAGGIDRAACNTAELIEGAREQERQGKLSHQLERLLARKARLEAERRGSASMQAPAQLIALAGNAGAQTMLSAEQTLLKLDRTRREQQRAETTAVAGTTRKEIEAMQAKLRQLNAQHQMHGEYLNDLRRVDGMATRNSLVRVRNDLAEIETRRQDIHVALANAEARLAQTERTIAKLESDHAIELAKSIAATEAELADVRLTLASAGLLAVALGQGNVLSARTEGATHPVYEIIRQGVAGPTALPAQENTQLLPDDVLKVSSKTPAQLEEASTVVNTSAIKRSDNP